MSSHHFVKEGQEPALLIVDAFTFEVAAPLLEWVPTVLVLEQALDDVLSWGIKIDVVLATKSDALLLTDKLLDQAPLTTIPVGGDHNPIAMALDFLKTRQQSGVNVLAFPTEELFRLVEKSKVPNVVVITADTKWSLCSTFFDKWISGGQKLWVKKSQPGQRISTEGLTGPEDQYETMRDGFILIRSADPFWVGETL